MSLGEFDVQLHLLRTRLFHLMLNSDIYYKLDYAKNMNVNIYSFFSASVSKVQNKKQYW